VLNNLGPHGLPLIGRADWNDCLNLNCFSETPDESYQTTGNRTGRTAESVFIAGMFVGVAPDYAYLAEKLGFGDEAKKARTESSKMNDTILKHGWDGEWFLRAYDFFGNKVGSNDNAEAKIFIEPQGFCVMAGIGQRGSPPPLRGRRLSPNPYPRAMGAPGPIRGQRGYRERRLSLVASIQTAYDGIAERPRLAALFGAMCIAFSGIFYRYALVSPSTVTVFRSLYGLPVLVLVAWLERRRFGPLPPRVIRLA
jgi:hypothetical protein